MMVSFAQISAATPALPLVLELEDELGSLADFMQRLAGGGWRVGELVTAVQIVLQGQGIEADFMQLGDDMLAQGLELFRAALLTLLQRIVG